MWARPLARAVAHSVGSPPPQSKPSWRESDGATAQDVDTSERQAFLLLGGVCLAVNGGTCAADAPGQGGGWFWTWALLFEKSGRGGGKACHRLPGATVMPSNESSVFSGCFLYLQAQVVL